MAMLSIQKRFGVKMGYSDHTLGIEVPIAAVALGGQMIEKHFTLDRSLPGPDQLASLEPAELKEMVSAIRNIELAISGTGIKEPSESEMKNISIVRKSLHFNRDLESGYILTENDIITLRPGTGISPMKISNYVGRQLKTSVKGKTILTDNCFK
jgi:N-acetylneuraminate synthase/N,N'-diacetyllegionaminate synthase